MAEFNVFPGGEAFVFKAPLYEQFQCELQDLEPLLGTGARVDGYCPFCRLLSTFMIRPRMFSKWREDAARRLYDKIEIQCARLDEHVVSFSVLVQPLEENFSIQKTGQYPSFADIAIDESKSYSSILSKEDSSEFHKAIGLAAHGVGIGSFVYIRRIFERLITSRFNEAKDAEGWTDEQFAKRRMTERIELLEGSSTAVFGREQNALFHSKPGHSFAWRG
jgi:hypothetical protein